MKDHPRVVWMDSSIRFINTGSFNIVGDNEGSPPGNLDGLVNPGFINTGNFNIVGNNEGSPLSGVDGCFNPVY